jgi:hypothetical protein
MVKRKKKKKKKKTKPKTDPVDVDMMMPAAPELVLSDVRGPTNATRSRFDVYYSTVNIIARAGYVCPPYF